METFLMKKLTVTALKKSLNEKNKKELIFEIAELYKRFPSVKEYYQAQGGNAEAVLEKYKDTIKKEFLDGYTRGFPKARLGVARKAVLDFKKISQEPKLLADIMFCFVEEISSFNTGFSVDGESYYTSPESMFEDVLKLLEKNELLPFFKNRANKIVENATDGWGHSDSLYETYSEFYHNS